MELTPELQMEITRSHIEYLHIKSGECLELFKDESDPLKRFIYCCIEKINKCAISIKILYDQLDKNEDIEFSIGIILRSLLMDAILTLYLMSLTLKVNKDDPMQQRELLYSTALKFIADGTSHILQDYDNYDGASKELKQTVRKKLAKIFPDMFEYDETGMPKIKREWNVNIKQLYKNSDNPELSTRKTVYELYAFYSKYDHISHWTSILGNIPSKERKHKVASSITMILFNFRNLLKIASLNEELRSGTMPLIADIDRYIKDQYSEISL